MTSPGETRYCLESSFIIDLLKGLDEAINLYKEIKDAPLTITAIASVALFEILRGEEKNPEKIQSFDELRSKLVVLAFGEREAQEASNVEKTIHQKGDTIHPLDLFIGVTAKTNEAVLITRNVKDFQKIEGLDLRSY